MNKVILNPKRDYSVAHHHPWVFSGAIRSVEGAPGVGDLVSVEDCRGQRLGWGCYSPVSQIRVRMLAFGDCAAPDAAYVSGLISASVGRRANFWVEGRTNGFRLVHGESDGLPGVVVDFIRRYINILDRRTIEVAIRDIEEELKLGGVDDTAMWNELKDELVVRLAAMQPPEEK